MTRTLGCLLFVAMAFDAAAAPPDGEGTRSAPRPEWEVLFAEEISFEEYARQLDYFNIEIGAVAQDNKIEYISKLSERKPEKRVGRREEDDRLYITWKSGTLEAADRKLLGKARINVQRKEILHFIPAETQDLMEKAQREYADREVDEIKRTRFKVREKNSGYEFVVVEQERRRPPGVGSSVRRVLNPSTED